MLHHDSKTIYNLRQTYLVYTPVPLNLVRHRYPRPIKNYNLMPHHFFILLYFKINLNFKTSYTKGTGTVPNLNSWVPKNLPRKILFWLSL